MMQPDWCDGGKARIGFPCWAGRGVRPSAYQDWANRVDVIWMLDAQLPKPETRNPLPRALARLHDRQAVPSRSRRRTHPWEKR